MSTTALDTDGDRDGLADVPLVLEDLLCQIEDFRSADRDPTAIAELWAQVNLLQGW